MNILAVILQEEANESFPLFNLNAGVIIWTWVIFIALVLILGRFAWRPILGALEARERHIQEILDAAARDREAAEQALAEHRRQLAEGRQQAQQILADSKQAGDRLRQEMLDTARRQQEELLVRARDDIRHEREQAVDQIRREAVDLSLAAASHLVERRLDTAEDRRLVQEYLASLEQSVGTPGAGGNGSRGRGS